MMGPLDLLANIEMIFLIVGGAAAVGVLIALFGRPLHFKDVAGLAEDRMGQADFGSMTEELVVDSVEDDGTFRDYSNSGLLNDPFSVAGEVLYDHIGRFPGDRD